MKNYTTIKTRGSTNQKTTCESYVLCGVDNVNKKNTQWIVVNGGIEECVFLMAQLEICRQDIEKKMLQDMPGVTKVMLQGMVEYSVERIRQKEREQEKNA